MLGEVFLVESVVLHDFFVAAGGQEETEVVVLVELVLGLHVEGVWQSHKQISVVFVHLSQVEGLFFRFSSPVSHEEVEFFGTREVSGYSGVD